MVIYSNEINDLLNKIFLYEISHFDNKTEEIAPVYNYFNDKLSNLDKLSSHTLSPRFPFNRDRLFSVVLGRFEFGYEFDGANVSVEIYRKLESFGDWLDIIIPESLTRKTILLTEKDIKKLVKAVIKEIYAC